ncbi:MAG: SdpI family protein [Nanoarchaeota archaeon]|nr:SdpI family protein [Nanoarchaeota archaeon]
MEKREYILISLILLMIIVSIFLYPSMPSQIPTHWGINGEIDDYSSKGFGLFFMPVFLAILYLLFLVIPKISVYKKNVDNFYKKYMFGFKLVFVIFFWAIYLGMILNAKGYIIQIKYFVLPALALMFFYIGYMMKYVKRNYFIGLRTPWTLANEKVWKKTHEMGGKLFYLLGLLTLIVIVLEKGFWIFIAAIIILVLYIFLYSYLEFRKQTFRKSLNKRK